MVNRVGTEELPNNDDYKLNPSLQDFDNQTGLNIRIVADEAWDKMNCQDIEAVFYT